MDFSGFIKNNPQLMGQAMGSLGGGGGQQGQPQARDAGPGVEPVRQPQDTGDKGYDGLKNVVKTVASFWFGGAGAGNIAQGAIGTAAGGRGGPAPAQASGGNSYAQTAQGASDQDWMKQWAGGFSG